MELIRPDGRPTRQRNAHGANQDIKGMPVSKAEVLPLPPQVASRQK